MSEHLQDKVLRELLAELDESPRYLGNEMDELSRSAYSKGPSALLARWGYYNLAEEPLDFHKRAIEKSGVDPNDTVLDLGCGTGMLMAKLRDDFDHEGPLIGLDPSRNMFLGTKEEDEDNEVQNPISFLQASAERLPLKKDSIDRTFGMFMLYHVQEASYALSEMSRVTKPDGTVMIATSGDNNKVKHRDFEIDIINFLRVFPTRPYSAHFDSDVAEITLPLFFDTVEELEPQAGDVVVTEETLPVYLRSLETIREDFIIEVSDERWARAIGAVVLPTIMADIEANGEFRDSIERHLYICSND